MSIGSVMLPVGTNSIVRLGAVARVQSGLTLDAGRVADHTAVSRPYLRVANVQDGWIDLSEVKEVSVPRALAYRCELRRGDVLMTEGGDPDKLGRGTVWDGAIPGCLHQNHIFAVRPTEVLLSRYLALITQTSYARAYFEATASKTTGIASTSISKIASFRIPLPPMDRQVAITRFVDAETARLDALITKKQRLIELLGARWRSAVVHRIQELGSTAGWLPLKRFVNCMDRSRVPLSAEERQLRPGSYPYFGASGQIDSIDDYLFDGTFVLLGEDGAQLGDPSYEISQVVRGKTWVNNHAHVLLPVDADPDFLALHLSTFDRSAFISGATREKITQEDMNQILIPALDYAEQAHEGRKFRVWRDDATKVCDIIAQQVAVISERRQALITAAVTGELDIPAQRAG